MGDWDRHGDRPHPVPLRVILPHPKLHERDRRFQLNDRFLNACGERDETAGLAKDIKGSVLPDSSLRDTENVPLSEDVDTYFRREVMPHAPDAWIDHEKTKVGYEIPFNRHFYVFQPPRPLSAIDADLKATTDRILTMIGGLTK